MTAEPLPTLPTARTCPYAPRAEHVELREKDPVAKVALSEHSDAWVVTRHEDIRAVLADTRFSSDRNHPELPTPGAEKVDMKGALPQMLISMDPPEHGPARRAVLGEFTVKRMNQLRPRIQEIVDERIDAMLAGPRPVDLVQALSLPVPSLVICEMLGVPYDDHDFFQTRSGAIVSHTATAEEKQRAVIDLLTYVSGLIKAKEEEPADDLLSRQILSQREQGGVDHLGLVAMAFLLLNAGHETTANMISLSTFQLSQDHEAREALRRNPGKTLGAVEELLRYFTIAEQGIGRVATEDIEVGGKVVPAGEGVFPLAHTGNRDPEVFEDPDRFDIDRGARNHLAFGYGPHQCLGQNLARLEMQIVIDTLLRRIPDIRPAVPVAELPFKDDALVYGIHEFPVTW
ncbi:cytochrome P450 [Nocardiopsis sp. NRRL B-16309]|uniref:cytochrome P450 n=1 Tax=Nocardiopsis sp. NRRL B-16309 TaxID=1519494 RepID=UPI0006AF778C|nr:cytochrome P450 [Nocardiopsis sp. NRRL B-16309]KOX11882.1 cytochrome P450 [Nocardiopsis sp. NRRL B-16309]